MIFSIKLRDKLCVKRRLEDYRLSLVESRLRLFRKFYLRVIKLYIQIMVAFYRVHFLG